MCAVSMEPVERLRRALFPIQRHQFGWRIASVAVSIVSIALILLTLGYKLRGSEPPSGLILALLAAFATVVLLLSRFLHVAHKQQGQTTAAFDQSERQFQSVFENALDAILILDSQGICQEANPAATKLFGLRRRDLIGRSVGDMYKDERQFQIAWQRLLTDSVHTGEAELLRDWDTSVFVEFSAKADCLPGQHVMILRDVTERRRAQISVAANLQLAKSAWTEAEALREATLALTQDLRMDNVMDTLLRSLMELVPFACARVFVSEGGSWVQALAEKTSPQFPKKSNVPALHLNTNDCPFLQTLIAEQKSILIPDTKEQKGWETLLGHQELRSWLSVPLKAADQYLGFLSIGHHEPNRFTQEHLRRAQLLATPASAAIQNARLYQTAQIYGSELEDRVAELKRTEAALARSEDSRRLSEEKFQKVFRSSPVPFSITTLNEGRFVDVNAAFEQRYGYSREEVLGRTVHELSIWEDPADRKLMLSQLSKGGPVRNVMTRIRTKSGEIKLTVYSADRIHFDGQPCVLAVSEDLPESDLRSAN
jgi:PAS domain S-box-containing protein